MMTFQIYGKIKVMFQTTNQLWSRFYPLFEAPNPLGPLGPVGPCRVWWFWPWSFGRQGGRSPLQSISWGSVNDDDILGAGNCSKCLQENMACGSLCYITIRKNGHRIRGIFHWKMVMFHSCVKLPEGSLLINPKMLTWALLKMACPTTSQIPPSVGTRSQGVARPPQQCRRPARRFRSSRAGWSPARPVSGRELSGCLIISISSVIISISSVKSWPWHPMRWIFPIYWYHNVMILIGYHY